MEHCPRKPPDVVALRRLIARLEGGRPRDGPTVLSSGCGPLDGALPEGGFRRGALVEWLAAGDGAGAVTLALRAAREACRDGGVLIVLDRCREFYPPAAVRMGIDLERLLVIHATGDADNTWALDQALRSPAVAAALAWPERLDGRTFRRLQLAAEEGGTLGLLVRPAAARHEPSWADVRLEIEPLPGASLCAPRRRLRIAVLRCRGRTAGGVLDVELDDETRTVHASRGLSQFSPERKWDCPLTNVAD
jgi:protein ImuA